MSTPTNDDLVQSGVACPRCGERHMDELVWIDDDRVECQTCGRHYDPAGKGGHEHDQPQQ